MKTAIITATALLTSVVAFADPARVSGDLKGLDPGKSVDVIVQYRESPTERHHEKIRAKGGQLKNNLRAIRAAAYSLPAVALESLASDPEVVYVSPDRPLRGLLDFANTAAGADIAQSYGWEGNEVGVAVVDSGISDHWDLRVGDDNPNSAKAGKTRIVYNETFLPLKTGKKNVTDEFGHGTHVAGIVAGNGTSSDGKNDSRRFRGIAPKANLINLRVLDQNGDGQDSYVIAAIQRAIELKSTYQIRVINLSLGRSVMEGYQRDPLCQAVEAAWKAGIVVVAAAGNDPVAGAQQLRSFAMIILSPGIGNYWRYESWLRNRCPPGPHCNRAGVGGSGPQQL